MQMSEVLAAGWHLAGTGPVRELEDKLAHWYGLDHCLAVSSATSGLMGIVVALELGGCEFVTTPYTWGGSIAPWLALGCRPIFADVDPRTMTLDPESVRASVTPRTRAILAVDIDGTPSDAPALRRVADEFGLWYIADAAQSFGATLGGQPASACADALVVSFTTGKPLDAAEGGAILTPHLHVHQKLIWHTQHPNRQARDVGLRCTNELAINARIHPAAADAANRGFDFALRQVAQRRAECLSVLKVLEGADIIDEAGLPGVRASHPSFYRLSVAARDRHGDEVASQMETCLAAHDRLVEVRRSPVKIVYRLPGFPAVAMSARSCRIAENESARRWIVRSSRGPTKVCEPSGGANNEPAHVRQLRRSEGLEGR